MDFNGASLPVDELNNAEIAPEVVVERQPTWAIVGLVAVGVCAVLVVSLVTRDSSNDEPVRSEQADPALTATSIAPTTTIAIDSRPGSMVGCTRSTHASA